MMFFHNVQTILKLLTALLIVITATSFSIVERPNQKRKAIVSLPITIEKIEILDERKNVLAGDIKIPVFAFKKDLTYSPELTNRHRKSIQDFFKNNMKGEGSQVTVIVHLLDTYKRYKTEFPIQRLQGYSKISVSIIKNATGEEIAHCESNAEAELLTDMNPKPRLELIYTQSLLRALYFCTKSLEPESETWK